jgi:hypothetical protein
MAELEEKRARLAAVECELVELGNRHELAMSAFKFDEARKVQQRIAMLERERGELVEALPPGAKLPLAPPREERVRGRRLGRRRWRLRR